MENHPQEKFMKKAIEEAKNSASLDQYSFVAFFLISSCEIIAVEGAALHENNDPTCHAEVNAIRSACLKNESRYLPGCWLYTTLEPCPMCTGTAIWAKMEGIVFGASKEDAQNFAKTLQDHKFTWRQIDISSKDIIEKGDPKVELIEKFMQSECRELFNFAKTKSK